MALDHDGAVGEFTRRQLPRIFEEYRIIIQASVDDALADDRTRAFLKKRLSRLDELTSQWLSTWTQLGLGQSWNLKEQDEREKALLHLEAQLVTECPHIFTISYYIPVIKRIPDDMEI